LTSSTAPATSTTSSAPSSSSSSSSNLNDFEQEILDEHNTKRALSGAQALVWNNTLAQYAADYAKSSFSCDNVQLIHSDGPYGENLAAGYSGGKDPVDAWYDEIKYYDFSNPGFSEKTGHYTQLVWQSSSQMGCAKVDCNNSWKQYTICEYSDTRGNIVGTDPKTHKNFFAENVIKPSSS
ncbi:PR-1-like protein, partial [Hyphopichia burtonii NRRL Y-1933]